MTIEEILETRDFYELMQEYRHSTSIEAGHRFITVINFVKNALNGTHQWEYTDDGGHPY